MSTHVLRMPHRNPVLRSHGNGYNVNELPKKGQRRLKPIPGTSAKKKKLKRLHITETDSRILALLKASEDGRKRAAALPPLEREPTFQRKPKHVNPYDASNDDAGDSHWKKQYEKVSIEVDNKVKNHLKKQLMHRFEKRLRKMEETLSDEMHGRHGNDYKPWDGKSKKKPDIFKQYTELGGKPGQVDIVKPAENHLPGIMKTTEKSKQEDQTDASVKFPDIKQNGVTNDEASSDEDDEITVGPVYKKSSSQSNEELNVVEDNEPDVFVTRTKSFYAEENFRKLEISPVPTPHVQRRPMTREQTRLSFDDKIKRILNGQVHASCPSRDKTFRIFLCSGFSDSDAERSVIMERIYPELRSICALHGRELQIIDPHWGLKDYVTDDHSIPSICLSNLQKCMSDQLQTINVVAILTDRYGDPVIPAILPIDEFENVYDAVSSYTNPKKAQIHQQLAMLEKPNVNRQRTTQESSTLNENSVQNGENDNISVDIKENNNVTRKQSVSTTITRNGGQKDQEIIKSLKQQEAQLPDPEVLTTWYKLDENCVPAVYRLQPISSVIQDYGKGDTSKREHSRQVWLEIQSNIFNILNEYGTKKYKKSLLEQELDVALQYADSDLEQCIVVTRELEDLEDNLNDLRADEYADLTSTKVHTLDWPVYRHLKRIKQETIPRKVSDQYILPFQARWATGGVRIGGDRMHQTYLDRMGKHLGDVMKRRVLEAFTDDMNEDIEKTKLFDEIAEHVVFFQKRYLAFIYIPVEKENYLKLKDTYIVNVSIEKAHEKFGPLIEVWVARNPPYFAFVVHKCKEDADNIIRQIDGESSHFQGMKESLHVIKSYLRSKCHSALVVHGRPGCGKSSVLAKAAKETHKWLKNYRDVAVLVRSVGSTKESTNIRNLLYNICEQLREVYEETEEIPADYIGLVNSFSQHLELANEQKPLVLFIDAVDRLDDDHQGRRMTWLPKRLPDNVHVILSTLPDESLDCMPSLKSLLGSNDDMFLEIPDLGESDAMIILNHWCNVHKHTVTQQQFDVVFNTMKKCPSPLFLKLLFNESLNWTSYTHVQESKLPDTVKRMASIKFGQMEIKYGEMFVRRAIGYIAASRNGITDHEMLDLLSLDDAVMTEVAPHYALSRRRIPPSLWYRLRKDMSIYITETKADDVKTLQWAHKHFYDAAKERYLTQRDKAPSYHKLLAEYFVGMWADKPKPYPGNDKGVLRHVTKHPFYWESSDAKTDGSSRVYNLRKINELPYHLLMAQQMQQYKAETVCNFEWVLSKLCGTSLRSLVEEYHLSLEMEPNDLDLKLMSDTLQLSGKAIQRDSRQLAGQIVGRLQGIVNRDVPSTPHDPPRYPFLHAMVAQAKMTSIPALVPSIGCLTEPGGILYDLLSGHTKPITAVTTTTDAQKALTSSEDNTLKVWELKNGKVIATIDDFGTNISKLRTAVNNKLVISVEVSVIKVWSLETKECCLVVDQYLDPPVITVASEGKLLVAFFDGVNALKTWDLEKDFKHVCESKIEDNSVFSDNSVVLAPHSYGDYVLHAFRGSDKATIQHARNGKVLHKLKCHDDSSSIVALAITRDYMILACRQHYMKLHEIHQLEMFDAKKGKYLRSIRGCTQDFINEIHINLVGSHAIVICASEASNASNIAIWNLETEDHKHLAKHAGVSSVGACADFRFCLTAQKGDSTLKIWNISKFINQPMPKLKKALGVAEIHPMIDNPRYAIARQVNHGPISIWNVAKAKCLASAVRIERNLSESSDVVLIRNTTVFILTEKGLKESKPVFKTILKYDLKAKRYIKKIPQCFIVPSPSHEYVTLDDDRLLGPAETRNHFIVWSLANGKELYRIKPQYSDADIRVSVKETDVQNSLHMRASTAKMTPWDRRTESYSAKQKRREKAREEEKRALEEIHREKANGIEQFIISGDLNVIVASFFAHHIAVFNLTEKMHTQTLQNEHSMLFLHVAALNYDGSCLVHANYDESSKVSYVTLWDTVTGQVKSRLKNESDVLAVAITEDGSRVVFGKSNKELRIWDTNKKTESIRKIKAGSLEFTVDSKIFTFNNGTRACVFASDISVWDLEDAVLLAVFTPDTRIECVNVVMSGQLITLGVHEFPELIVLKIMGRDIKAIEDKEHEDLFGESTGDTSDEEEDEEDDI